MSKSVSLCFVTHNHQPIGNFDNVIEEAYNNSYRPFFEIAARHPNFRFGTHFTGILLDWLEQKHPEHIAALAAMCASGQLEMVTGGFYEPILSIIPVAHQHKQIAKLSAAIDQLFHQTPSSLWLAERVWEQQLASVISEAGVRAVYLDDTHFLGAGLRGDDLNGYYITEDNGQPLAVFPISKPLRYTIPFQSVDETLAVLREAATEDGSAFVCFADDGEKFGVWPNTFEHVYKDGWLDELMTKLTENRDWIAMRTPSEVIREVRPRGRIYLPNSSYAEMMHWALPTPEAYAEFDRVQHLIDAEGASPELQSTKPFVRGGYWRNFLVKYPESNHLHKHILQTTKRLEETRSGINAELCDTIEDHLLAAECNDPFWHGVFGGLYLPNLRHGNYSRLLSGDKLLDKAVGITHPISTKDFDLDGYDDLVVENDFFALYFDPNNGGRLTELDVKPRAFNVINTVQRRKEGYHLKLTEIPKEGTTAAKSIHDMVQSKEGGLEKYLIYDWYSHTGFQEHFLDPDVTLSALREMTFAERGSFLQSAWGLKAEETAAALRVYGSLLGSVVVNEARHDTALSKAITVGNDGALRIAYKIENRSAALLALSFGSEWLANFLAGDADDRYYSINGERLTESKLREEIDLQNVKLFSITDEWLKIRMSFAFEQVVRFVAYPLETVSQSEGGFERLYQGSVLMPIWELSLKPNESWSVEFDLSFDLL